MILAFPLFIATIYAPFPLAWVCLFLGVFFVFLNTGPSNAALANVAPPNVRASAFALNILVIHLFGDAFSPPLLGYVAGRSSMNVAFFIVSIAALVSGVIWLLGMKHLARDTAAAAPENGNSRSNVTSLLLLRLRRGYSRAEVNYSLSGSAPSSSADPSPLAFLPLAGEDLSCLLPFSAEAPLLAVAPGEAALAAPVLLPLVARAGRARARSRARCGCAGLGRR